MAEAKKTFKMIENPITGENPALAFINTAQKKAPKKKAPEKIKKTSAKKAEAPAGVIPDEYKADYEEKVEKRSKRVQLLFSEAVLSALKELAQENGQSVNELANRAIKAYLLSSGKSF